MQSTIILIKGVRSIAILLVAGLFFCLAGCTKNKRPPGILSDKELSEVLIDVYLAESKLATLKITRDSAGRLFKPFEEAMLTQNKVSRAALKETYRYYLDHPADFQKVYEIVMDTLNLREQRLLHAQKKNI